MKIQLNYCLDMPLPKVWSRLKKVSTLHYVANPILKFKAINPANLPQEWSDGDYETALLLFGFIPFGRQHIVIEIPNEVKNDTKILIDHGYGSMVQTWRHTITLVRKTDSQTLYQDDVVIQAGVLTPFVWIFAWVFYRWRRRNWFKLIKSEI
jgi:hypothetical protein